MPEHVYLTPVPDSTSEPSALSSRNIPSQVVVSRATLCTLFSPFFRQSFQWKIHTRRNHSLSASARSTEHLCWLRAKSNTCASVTCLGRLPKKNTCATATHLGCSPKVTVRNVAKGKFLTGMYLQCHQNLATQTLNSAFSISQSVGQWIRYSTRNVCDVNLQLVEAQMAPALLQFKFVAARLAWTTTSLDDIQGSSQSSGSEKAKQLNLYQFNRHWTYTSSRCTGFLVSAEASVSQASSSCTGSTGCTCLASFCVWTSDSGTP